MTYRLSIIISLILLGVVLVYLRRKEGWEWDRIVLLFSVVVVVIAIGTGIGIFVYIKMSDQPDIQTSFWDINLESSKPSVEFIKGPPIAVTDEGYWIYVSKITGDAEVYVVRFKDDQLWVVGYIGGGSTGGPGIQGIRQGSSLSEVKNYFGEPSHVVNIRSGGSDLYLYDTFNAFFVIKGGNVSLYGAYNPQIGLFVLENEFETYLSQFAAGPR